MAYREKIAWFTLASMMIFFTVFAAGMVAVSRAGQPGAVQMISVLAGVTILQVVLLIAAAAVMAIRGRKEAAGSPDERDRAIAQRGTRIAYFVLLAGTFTIGVALPFAVRPWIVYSASMFALATAETVRYATIVISYRRGWHG